MSAKHIAKTLKTLRKENKLTQRQMAKIVDISVSHYNLIEKGEISPSIFEVLMMACNKFNLTLDYFMTYPEAEIYSHEELPTPEEDELIMLMSMYMKKLDLQSLKILYNVIIFLDNTNCNNSRV